MFGISWAEFLVIVLVAVLVVPARMWPDVARFIARVVNAVRAIIWRITDASENIKQQIELEKPIDDLIRSTTDDVLSGISTKLPKNNKKTITQRIDDIVTNKYLAIPIFILIMFAVFTITFSTIGAFLQRSVSYIVGDLLAGFVSNLLISFNTPNWVESLVVDGDAVQKFLFAEPHFQRKHRDIPLLCAVLLLMVFSPASAVC